MTNSSKYALSVGLVDQKRMRHLNDLYNPDTQQFLLASGLKPGMRVLDVACGTGIVTRWLAEQVGEQGHVHAIDENDLQLEIAKKNVAGMSNVSLEQRSVFSMDDLAEQFDLVYSRFLLIHLAEPEVALKNMALCLKPNGVLAIVSAMHSAFFSEPHCEAFYQFFKHALAVISQNGSDPYWGKKLLPAMQRLGLKIGLAKSFMPILHSTYDKEFIGLSLKTIEQQLFNRGMTADELAKIYQGIDEFVAMPNSYYSFTDCMMVCGHRIIGQ